MRVLSALALFGRPGLIGALLALFLVPLVPARLLGMATDDMTDSVIVFDADTGAILGSVTVGPGLVGDRSISGDQAVGFVTDTNPLCPLSNIGREDR